MEAIAYNADYSNMITFAIICAVVWLCLFFAYRMVLRNEKRRRNEFKFDDPGDFYHGDIYKK
ncbi:MAG: hypothetical protein M0P71_16880 [Melioribacteraceae bacterium]|jgi:predicted permease|nr:hypothetical protein [Melioribacteraceae bacterium]